MECSYSFVLDLVLSHWAHSLCLDSFVFMVVFLCVILSYCICVVLLQHGGVDLVGLKLVVRTFLHCFDTVGWSPI